MGHFDHLNVAFFTKAAIYPGSIGTFRYRFQREGWTDGKGTLTVWVYDPRPSRGRRRAWSR